MVAREDEIPLTSTWKRLADDEATFEVMIVEVPTEPPRLEVRMFPEEEREFEVERLVTVSAVAVALVITALVVVEFATCRSVMLASVATRDAMNELVEVLLVVTRLVAVAFVAVRSVMIAVTAFRRVEKRLLDVAFVVVRLVIVEEEKIGVSVSA